jgi:hypothetical protein
MGMFDKLKGFLGGAKDDAQAPSAAEVESRRQTVDYDDMPITPEMFDDLAAEEPKNITKESEFSAFEGLAAKYLPELNAVQNNGGRFKVSDRTENVGEVNTTIKVRARNDGVDAEALADVEARREGDNARQILEKVSVGVPDVVVTDVSDTNGTIGNMVSFEATEAGSAMPLKLEVDVYFTPDKNAMMPLLLEDVAADLGEVAEAVVPQAAFKITPRTEATYPNSVYMETPDKDARDTLVETFRAQGVDVIEAQRPNNGEYLVVVPAPNETFREMAEFVEQVEQVRGTFKKIERKNTRADELTPEEEIEVNQYRFVQLMEQVGVRSNEVDSVLAAYNGEDYEYTLSMPTMEQADLLERQLKEAVEGAGGQLTREEGRNTIIKVGLFPEMEMDGYGKEAFQNISFMTQEVLGALLDTVSEKLPPAQEAASPSFAAEREQGQGQTRNEGGVQKR